MPKTKTSVKKVNTKGKSTTHKEIKAVSPKPSKSSVTFGSRVTNLKDSYFKSLKTSNKSRAISAGVIIVALLLILLPHLAVAWVDGKPITIFSYYHALDQKYGKDTKDQMISEQLVTDEAAKRGVSVSQDEVNSQIKLLEDQASGSANLNDILAQQGLTRSDFEKQIKLQSLIKKMFDSEASVSSQDVDNYIQQNKSQLPDPVDDKTKQSITDQLKQQKLVQAFQTWLSGAQNSNRVIKL
jgi:hypothetical protein